MILSDVLNTSKPPLPLVKEAIAQASYEELPAVLAVLEHDSRKQVAACVAAAWKRRAKETKMRERVLAMYDEMRALGGSGIVLGIDEVGRGPLAGPLTVAAVALSPDRPIWGIDDSKRLSAATREVLAGEIAAQALAFGICHVEPAQIDEEGMARSLRHAIRGAIADSGVEPDAVLIDGVPLHVHPNETCIVKGDAKVACIAAASIVAKVTRDAMMVAADGLYPGYGFAQNKGYGSADHIAAIEHIGLSPLHRKSFCKNFARPQDA